LRPERGAVAENRTPISLGGDSVTFNAMQINGYAVEQAANGTWWVRPAQGRHAWRFADRSAALRFVRQLRPPAAAPDSRPPTPLRGRAVSAQRWRA
jgi:hypothetical protein